jgi:hypothetical protein
MHSYTRKYQHYPEGATRPLARRTCSRLLAHGQPPLAGACAYTCAHMPTATHKSSRPHPHTCARMQSHAHRLTGTRPRPSMHGYAQPDGTRTIPYPRVQAPNARACTCPYSQSRARPTACACCLHAFMRGWSELYTPAHPSAPAQTCADMCRR